MESLEHSHWVIIPAYNGKSLLETCISSVLGSTVLVHVLVVDNNSDDGTNKNYVHGLGAEYIRNATNRGFGAACNVGISHAINRGASSATILNQDARLAPDCIEQLFQTLTSNKDTGIACPLIYDDSGYLFPNFSNWLVNGNRNFLRDLLQDRLEADYEVPFLNAACWMFSIEALKSAGGFDTLFFMYQEDKELAARFHYYGYKFKLNPHTYIEHSSTLTAKKNNTHARIRWLSVAPLSNMLAGMRNYNRSFWRGLPSVIRNWLSGVFACLLAGRPVATIGYLVAALKFLILSPQNRKNYQLVKSRTPSLFLDLEQHE